MSRTDHDISSSSGGRRRRQLTCWLLDTRSLWSNGAKIAETAPEELKLLSGTEREACLRKYHLADAKMALGSALLKRLFVSKTLGLPWKNVKYGRKKDPTHGKPCALMPDGTPAPLEFNVSHQAGLVALVGCDLRDSASTDEHEHEHADVELGVDIVCVNERNDYRVIDTEGFDAWVDIYTDVFSAAESDAMKTHIDAFALLDGTRVTNDNLSPQTRAVGFRNQELIARLPSGEQRRFSSELLIDAKLRTFYTYWCFKEAYIKLDGAALLANWIKELEFRGVRAPGPGTVARCSTVGVWGERVSGVEVWRRGSRLGDVRVEIVGFEEDFMIAVAARPEGEMPEVLTGFEMVHLETDVLGFVGAG